MGDLTPRRGRVGIRRRDLVIRLGLSRLSAGLCPVREGAAGWVARARPSGPKRAEAGVGHRKGLQLLSFHASFGGTALDFVSSFLFTDAGGGYPCGGLMFEWWRGEGGPPNSTVLITDLTSILATI